MYICIIDQWTSVFNNIPKILGQFHNKKYYLKLGCWIQQLLTRCMMLNMEIRRWRRKETLKPVHMKRMEVPAVPPTPQAPMGPVSSLHSTISQEVGQFRNIKCVRIWEQVQASKCVNWTFTVHPLYGRADLVNDLLRSPHTKDIGLCKTQSSGYLSGYVL